MSKNSAELIDKTLSGACTSGQKGIGSDGNERVLHMPQNFSITESLPSDRFVSYTQQPLGRGSYQSAEIQSVYSTASDT